MRICPEVAHCSWLRAVSVCQAQGHSQVLPDAPVLYPPPPHPYPFTVRDALFICSIELVRTSLESLQ